MKEEIGFNELDSSIDTLSITEDEEPIKTNDNNQSVNQYKKEKEPLIKELVKEKHKNIEKKLVESKEKSREFSQKEEHKQEDL